MLLFASGKCVVVGGKSVCDAPCGAKHIAELVSSMFTPCEVNAFTVRNMVFTARTPFRLRIDALYEQMRALKCFRQCFYDSICFPGIGCSVHAGKSPSLLIFASGRIICSGLKRSTNVLDFGNIFMPFINTYKSHNL
ncbi:TATA-box-binding protein [Aphelenchoides avenae]|nr:TATA-box-binding protein [Aphelenchus avenae]